jgi:carboxyl-terminal processing protease
MKTKKLQVVILVIIAALVGYFFGKTQVALEWHSFHPQLSVSSKEPPSSLTNVDASQLWTVWDKVNASYYDRTKLDERKMMDGAISGMVASIGDPYTMYLPPTQQTNFQQQLAGKFGGIGAELGLRDKQIIVVAPLDGTPAQKAGIKPGDAILKVDGQSTATWSLSQTVEKIRGPKGTSVVLTIQHKDAKDTKDIIVMRDTITVKSVDGWIKKVKDIPTLSSAMKSFSNANTNIEYIRLSQFGDSTNTDWTALVNKLHDQEKKNGNIKGIVLDVRSNPGGYLTDATFVAGEFLPEGTPVVQQDDGNSKTVLSVTRQGTLLDKPLVVLIDRGSASASEIVSGALRDNKRAKLVGDQSFGKGTIQEALDLGGGAGLHVTIAKWLTPNGTWVHGKGLTPDVKVLLDPKDQTHDTQLEKAIQTLVE